MTMPLDVQQDIREMDAGCVPRSEIARRLGISRNTVAKYADMEDMSPAVPLPIERRSPVTDSVAGWIDGILEEDLGAPRKQRHTAKRIFDRLVEEHGFTGSYSTVRRYVARWRKEHSRPSGGDGSLELEWAPGTAQVDYGNFRCVVAGRSRALKLLVLTLPHSNGRFCMAQESERSECLCSGLRETFEWMGRAPHTLVLDNATEAGRRIRGKVTESVLFSQFRSHYRVSSRYCNPYSGNEKGSVENAVGYLRRNLLVPVPSFGTIAELNSWLREGCDRINAASRARDGRPTAEAMAEDLSAMLSLPGVPFDAVRWTKSRSDNRGYVRLDGVLYCAGPAWHNRDLLVGARADSVEILADRGRRVARLPRSWQEGEVVRSPLSLIPALVARPRAFGESTIREDMPPELVGALDTLDLAGRRRALRAIQRAAETSGFEAACAAAALTCQGGRVPDDAAVDLAARRLASGSAPTGGDVDLTVYDALLREGDETANAS